MFVWHRLLCVLCVAALTSMICISSALALVLISIVILCVCWWVCALPQVTNSSSAGEVLTGKWGQRCRWHTVLDKQDVWIVNPTNQNPQCHAVIHKQEVMWLTQTGASATAALPADRYKLLASQKNRFIFQLPVLAFSSVTTGNFCSRPLLAGQLSSLTHCKREGKMCKKSTCSEVISIMKFKLPFINGKKKSTNSAFNPVAVGEKVWCGISFTVLELLMVSACRSIHVSTLSAKSNKNVCRDQIGIRSGPAANKTAQEWFTGYFNTAVTLAGT